MNTLQLMKYAVVLVGIGALIKGVILMLWPSQYAGLARWWFGLPAKFLRVVGVVLLLIGLAAIGVGAAECGNRLIAATIVLGTLLVLAGFGYQTPQVMQQAVMTVVGNQVVARICGVLAVLIAGVLLYVGLR